MRKRTSEWLVAFAALGATYAAAIFAVHRLDREPPAVRAPRRPAPATSPGIGAMAIMLVIFVLAPAAVLTAHAYQSGADRRDWASRATGGDASRGERLLVRYGCAACHTISGSYLARGTFGPPIQGLADRANLAGAVRNTPDNLVAWIAHARNLSPTSGMPNTDAPEQDARDIAAFLYSH
jgi:cytochrome c